MGLMVYLGTPREPVNTALLRDADWGGMLLFGTAVSMIYAGLDQGNRLDWLESGTVMALLLGGGVLFVLFVINEFLAPHPWAHINVLFSRNVGLSLVIILLYTLTSLCNSSLVPNFLSVVGGLRPEQTGVLLFTYGRAADVRAGAVLGLSAAAFRCPHRGGAGIFGVRRGQSLGHAAQPRLGAGGFHQASCC